MSEAVHVSVPFTLNDNGWTLNLNFFPIATTTINTTQENMKVVECCQQWNCR